jgi:hypothetical protein
MVRQWPLGQPSRVGADWAQHLIHVLGQTQTADLRPCACPLDVQPQEMIFLDDVDRAVAGAREAGIHTVRYRDNAQAIGEIEQLTTP